MHVVLESLQAEQKGPAIEGFDGRVVGLNTRPVDAAVVVWLHRRFDAVDPIGRAPRSGGDRRPVRQGWRRHSSGSAKVTIMLLPIGASSSEA